MTVVQDAPPTVVRLRTPRHSWIPQLMAGVLWLGFAAMYRWVIPDSIGWSGTLGVFWLGLGLVSIAEAFWLRTLGVDLTPESAVVRGFWRRRTIAWREIQGVVSRQRAGTWVVQLLPEHGKLMTLRAATSYFGFGVGTHVQQFHQIGQWWLAHRGVDWRPAPPPS